MKVLAIDPGNEKSAFVIYEEGKLIDRDIIPNDELLIEMVNYRYKCQYMAIEMIASYGMAVGKTIFETCVWIGRFIQKWDGNYTKIYRKDVTMHLCNSMRAKDSNIRQAIIDRYPAAGGGKTPQIGTKAKPGPLYGVSKDVWSALAVAIYATETIRKV